MRPLGFFKIEFTSLKLEDLKNYRVFEAFRCQWCYIAFKV